MLPTLPHHKGPFPVKRRRDSLVLPGAAQLKREKAAASQIHNRTRLLSSRQSCCLLYSNCQPCHLGLHCHRKNSTFHRFKSAIFFFASSFAVYGICCTKMLDARARILPILTQKVEPTSTEQDLNFNRPYVPDAFWPTSIWNEDSSSGFETISHPADPTILLSVPSFWSRPLHRSSAEGMARDVAMKIGTCTQLFESRSSYKQAFKSLLSFGHTVHTNHHVDVESCPLHERTIFVMIASYRDYQCRETVASVFERATYPDRIRVGVVDQIIEGVDVNCNDPVESCQKDPSQVLCKYQDQIDVFTMEASLSVGPVFARHIGNRLYRGEYYSTQLDAHVTMVKGWDVDIISQFQSTGNEMAVLSTYLSDVHESMDAEGNSLVETRPIMCYTIYEEDSMDEDMPEHLRHDAQPEREATIVGSPQLQPWWAAGYSFARGHFTVNVPYDLYQPMIFQGEEMSVGIRGFTVGYDFYAPERSVCFHHYNRGKDRPLVPSYYDDNSKRFAEVGKGAMLRLLGIVHMTNEVDPKEWDHRDEDIYGIGTRRSPEKFYETFGINVEKKTIEGHLCRFVHDNGTMHKSFTPFLREDGMGIDYSKITYRFRDPDPTDEEEY